MLHGNNIMMLVHEGLPERGKCCTVTYDAIHDGMPERGNVAR